MKKPNPHTGTWHKYRINYKHVLSTGMFVDISTPYKKDTFPSAKEPTAQKRHAATDP